MPIFNLSFFKMNELPEHWKPRLRELSYGPEEGTTYRWSYSQGKCYACVLRYGDRIVAWSAITFDEDEYPIVGCYVEPTQRRKGLGRACANFMLEVLDLPKGTLVYAYARLWAAWPDILAEADLVFVEWES